MEKIKRAAVFLLVGTTALLSLGGCFLSGNALSPIGHNSRSAINDTIKTESELFGVEFKLKKRRLTDAFCDIEVTCPETGDKRIRIRRPFRDSWITTDYIYVRYGSEAYSAIKAAAEKAEPGCKVTVQDKCYNHFPAKDYDSSTDLAGYLADNNFHIALILPYKDGITKEELAERFSRAALLFADEGINCEAFSVCMTASAADFEAYTSLDHIPFNGEDTEGSDVKMRASVSLDGYGDLFGNCRELGNKERYLFYIDGNYERLT